MKMYCGDNVQNICRHSKFYLIVAVYRSIFTHRFQLLCLQRSSRVAAFADNVFREREEERDLETGLHHLWLQLN